MLAATTSNLVYFITGLRPVEVAVRGVEGTFPNGNVGYMWSAGQVTWENGAVMSITDGLGYPDEAAGTNDQCLAMYCEGDDCGAVLKHDDQYRGVRHGYVDRKAGAAFRFVSPDYFRLVPWQGDGLKPVGYGYDSIEANVLAAQRVNAALLPVSRATTPGRHALPSFATSTSEGSSPRRPTVGSTNLVTEAARLSIAENGWPAEIRYEPTPLGAIATGNRRVIDRSGCGMRNTELATPDFRSRSQAPTWERISAKLRFADLTTVLTRQSFVEVRSQAKLGNE